MAPAPRGRQFSRVDQDFKEALGVIRENYIDGNKMDYNAVTKSSITGMLRTLDPHSSYFDREEFEELKTDQRSEYFGIRRDHPELFIRRNSRKTYITATFANSPASRGGLRYGDRIDAGRWPRDARQAFGRRS
jgi:carboxyl-terminal processing protease